MHGESLDHLTDIILQMRINLQHVIITFQEQTAEIRQELAIIFDQERKTLDACVDRIDRKLQDCAAQAEEYRRLHLSLSVLREKLTELGAEPAELPIPPLPERIEDIICSRVDQLKCHGII
jgi:hypothetical protein